MLNSNLELRIRIIKGEVRENKREKEKCWNAILGLIGCFISLIVGSIYFFVIKKEREPWNIFFAGLLGLAILPLGYYWYNKYQKKKQIAKLERELYLLKKDLKKED